MIASKVDTVGLSGAAVLPAEGTDIGGMYHVLRLDMIYRRRHCPNQLIVIVPIFLLNFYRVFFFQLS